MPTAADGRYLRTSKSLSKCKANKENEPVSPKTSIKVISTKSPLKSKRKVGNFKTPMKTPMTLKNNATKSTTKPQPVPDFSKLHRKWTESFERGKACKKKPCTMVQEFDITRTGTKFKRAKSFTDKSNDYEGLDLNNCAAENDENRSPNVCGGRADLDTPRSSAKKLRRKILGELNCENNSPTRNFESPDEDKFSLASLQKQEGLEFYENSPALRSILNNVGVSMRKETASNAIDRQTIAGSMMTTPRSHQTARPGGVPQTNERQSCYLQRPTDPKRTFSEYHNLVLSRLTSQSSSSMRASNFGLSSVRQSLGKALRIPKHQPNVQSPVVRIAKEMEKTPLLSPAVRVLNKNASRFRDGFQSVDTPTQNKQKSDRLAVKLSYGDENSSPNVPSPQTQQDVNKLKELEEIEKQLEKEILELEKRKQLSPQTIVEIPSSSTKSHTPPASSILRTSPKSVDSNKSTSPQKHVHFSSDLESDLKKGPSEKLFSETSPKKHCYVKRQSSPSDSSFLPPEKKIRSVDELNMTLDEVSHELQESMVKYTSAESEMKKTKSKRRSMQILVQLEEMKKQQQEMLKIQAQLQQQLLYQQNVIEQQQKQMMMRVLPLETDPLVKNDNATSRLQSNPVHLKNSSAFSSSNIVHKSISQPKLGELSFQPFDNSSKEFLTQTDIVTPKAMMPSTGQSSKKEQGAFSKSNDLTCSPKVSSRNFGGMESSPTCRRLSDNLNKLSLPETATATAISHHFGKDNSTGHILRPSSLMSKIVDQKHCRGEEGVGVLSLKSHTTGDQTSELASNHGASRSTVDSIASRDSIYHNRKITEDRKDSVGSLSLYGSLQSYASQTPKTFSKHKFSQSLIMKTALHLHDTLLDDECSLYTCRLPIKITSEFSPRCFNPVAKLLQEGDDMHFAPIREPWSMVAPVLTGSAFCSYTPLC